MPPTTNLNPKNDSLMVLKILVQNCPDGQFGKDSVLNMITRVMNEPNPQTILKGADLVDYMQTKERMRVVHGPANTNHAPGGSQ